MTEGKLHPLDDGRLLVADEYLDLLRWNGLDTFEAVMRLESGRMMRSVPGRSTVRVELRRPHGGVQAAFLKRYEREYLTPGKRLLRLLRWPAAQDEARHEWRMIRVLRASGFNTASPMAVGQQRRGGLVVRSFLMTAEIEDGVAAHDHMKRMDARRRRILIARVADLTRRFHGAGFIHKDYYLSHILVVEKGSEAELFFIDLQRVAGPGRFHARWRIKDLAALAYSGQLSGATRADLLRFHRQCFNKGRLDAADHAFVLKVMSRVNGLHRRGPKHDVIWDQPGVRPPNV